LEGTGASSVNPLFSQEDKDAFEKDSTELALTSAFYQEVAISPPCLALIELGCPETSESLSLVAGAASTMYGLLALDPIDNNFTVIPIPAFPTLPPVKPGKIMRSQTASLLNGLINDLEQQIAYQRAVVTAVNRAEGALAAGSTFWEQQQLQAASVYSARIAILADDISNLQGRLARQLSAVGFPSIEVTPSMLAQLVSSISQSGLPSALVSQLSQLGFDSSDISTLQTKIEGVGTTTSVFFPGMLTDAIQQQLDSAAAQDLLSAGLSFAVKYSPGGINSTLRLGLAGSTIPLKFTLNSPQGQPVTNALAGLQVFSVATGGATAALVILPSGRSNKGALFRFDPVSQQYIYNLSTSDFTPGTYVLQITLDDGTRHVRMLQLK
jgi:hypothetical protein